MKWTKYAIMHKDRKVASINSDGTCKIYFSTFLPYNLYLEESDDIDDRLNNLVNFYAWCSSRMLTLDRQYDNLVFLNEDSVQHTFAKGCKGRRKEVD